MNVGATPKVTVTSLPEVTPPAPASGGRMTTPAGEIAQIFSNVAMRHVAYIEFMPSGAPRGNHYHKQKHQYIYIIKGKLEVTTIDLATGTRETHILKTGDLEYCPPNVAHVHTALEYTQALDMSSDPYDSSDTIAYQVS